MENHAQIELQTRQCATTGFLWIILELLDNTREHPYLVSKLAWAGQNGCQPYLSLKHGVEALPAQGAALHGQKQKVDQMSHHNSQFFNLFDNFFFHFQYF